MSSSPQEPEIVAVIVNYNAGPWLLRSVSALLNSRCPARVQVVDNASEDRSLQPLRALQSSGRITLRSNEANLGFGRACNRALADAAEPYFLLVNPDCAVEPETVGELLKALKGDPGGGIAGAMIIGDDGREQRASRRRAPTLRRTLCTFLGLERLGLEGVNVRAAPPSATTAVEAVSGALMLIRASCFRALGGFDEDYFLHCEDLDLFARARAVGWRVLFVPAARARHGKGVSHRGRRLLGERYKHAGMVRYFKRHLYPASPRALRWLWPALIWSRYLALTPALLWRQWRESR